MLKKLIILFALMAILAALVVMLTSGSLWPWPAVVGQPINRTVEPSAPVAEISGIGQVTPQPANSPAQPDFASNPVCFTPEQLPPLAFSADSTKILVRASSGVQLFDLKTGSLIEFINASQNLIAATVSPDGKTIAWSLQDGTLQLVNLSSQAILANLVGHPDPVYHLQFSPTGDKLVSASHDGLVRIWDMKGNLLAKIEPGREVVGFGISQDGSRIAIIPFDGPVSIWDLEGYTKIIDLSGTGGYDTSDASFSSDGQYVAADLATGIFLWRISDASLVWHQVSNSMAVAFSPDGQYLAYSDIDDGNKVILASADATQTIRVVDKMQSPVWALIFSPDSSLLSVTDGVEIRVWRVDDGALLAIGKAVCP